MFRRVGVLILVLLAFAVPAGAERAQDLFGGTQDRDRPAPRVDPAAWALDPPVLYLGRRPEADFLEERRARLLALAEADRAIEEAAALLDLAEFHLAHGMAPEGLSILSDLSSEGLPPVHRLRAAAYELALGLLDYRERPLSERALALLEPKHAGWPDQVLFRAVRLIDAGDHEGAAPHLAAAADRLARFPEPVQERWLPGFLESAIATRQWRLARDMAARFDDLPVLRGGTAYHFLLGQAAEAGDDTLGAFDSYAHVMGGKDLWAHRARRAIVDMGLRENALSSSEAAALLAIERELWHGDEYAAETLQDLASLQMIEGDVVAAVVTYGQTMAAYPGTAHAQAARQKAHALIDTLYQKGAEGTISLSEFMEVHSRIESHYRFDVTFADAAELFADTFYATGATTIAATEYEVIHDYLAVARDLGIDAIDEDRLAGLRLKQAEALLAGGQYDQLARLLELGIRTEDPDQIAKRDLIAAEYYRETGQPAEIAEQGVGTPSVRLLTLRAQAHFDAGNWDKAEMAYAELWALEGEEMPFSEAMRFLLAAYRNGNMVQTAALAEEFPRLTTLPGWAEIAAGLTESAPELLPLREDNAQARIDNAADTLETLSDTSQTN
ncbi:MAG: hypothetical protein ACU0DK_08835 [Pseudooceanicola sp.]